MLASDHLTELQSSTEKINKPQTILYISQAHYTSFPREYIQLDFVSACFTVDLLFATFFLRKKDQLILEIKKKKD